MLDEIIPFHLEFYLGLRKEELNAEANFENEDIDEEDEEDV